MNFGQAIEEMKRGKKVTRESWLEGFFSGKKAFIFIGKNQGMKTDAQLPIPANREPYADCIMHYTRKGQYCPNWIPTQEDMLAEDWSVYLMKYETIDPTIPEKPYEYEIPLRCGTYIEIIGTGKRVEIGSVKIGTVYTVDGARYNLLFKAKEPIPRDDRIYKNIKVGHETLTVYDNGIDSFIPQAVISEIQKERILRELINGER